MDDAMRAGFALVLFSLSAFSSADLGWAGRQRDGHSLHLPARASWGDLPSTEIDGEMVEQLWIYCRFNLVQTIDNVKEFGIFFPEELLVDNYEVNSIARSLAKVELQKALNILPPQMKENLLDCLREKNSLPFFSVKESHGGSLDWIAGQIEKVLGWRHGRRNLVGTKGTSSIASPSPAPAPLARSPTYNRIHAAVPSPINSVAPSPNEEDWIFPPDPPETFMESSTGKISPPVPESPLPTTSKGGSNKKAIAISVVATASGTFLFAALLFCCYNKCNRNRTGLMDGHKDDRPLLTVSFSDFSVGSSHKSFNLEKPVNREKFESLSVKSSQGTNGWISSSEINSFSIETDNSKPSLPLPPAAVAASLEAAKSLKGPAPITAPTSGPVAPPPPPPPMKPPSIRPTPPGPPPPPPPMPSGIKAGPRPPPPPKAGPAPPRPPLGSRVNQPSPLGPNHAVGQGYDVQTGAEAPKAKLKPFFWDKVPTNPDHSMVWHQISSGSFQFNEEMIETLFGYNNTAEKKKDDRKKQTASSDPAVQFVQILDPKKSQNLSILLRALNVTVEEVCDALTKGHELPAELLQTFLKMSPTTDEELKLRLYSGDPSLLLPAERFLKALVDIPYAFKRLDALLYMTSCQEEISGLKESFSILEVACKELRSSRLFLKLLEAVLKTGNRMNDGTYRGRAQAFKLDTLLKLADVRGTDGKTTLLHFVVQEIMRSEGIRQARTLRESTSMSSVNSEDLAEDSSSESNDHYSALGLQVVAGLSGELENVKKAAILDADTLTGSVANLGHGLIRLKEFLNKEMKSLDEKSGFQRSLESFVVHVEDDITWLLEEEKRIKTLVKGTTDYFHGNTNKDEGLRVFVIVRDFLGILEKVCKEIKESTRKMVKTPRNRETPPATPVKDPRELLFPAIKERRMGSSGSDSSSDDEK